ncbi:MAG TPA: efflux RND transporter periplasmic adaptor subunit [Isosphaeraceae bacterium]|nr:efflux RND transporter periplasmic adaptor subunit [Isosphaeraceae bacterium]
MRHIIVTAVGLVALVACLTAANLLREPRAVVIDWQLVRQPPKEVFVEPAARGPIVQVITAPGIVESVEEAKIASQIVGRVIAVHVKDGDSVKRGDLLVKLDDTDARARLDSARARVARLHAAIAHSGADLQKADRDIIILSRLASKGASTPTELADAESALAKAQAMIEMSRQELVESEAMCRTSQQELDRTEIRAPIDGVVAGLQVEVGEVVIPGTMNLPGAVLMVVSDLRRMRARADVDESDKSLVRPGQPAVVYLQDDRIEPIVGTVDRVSPKGKRRGERMSAGAQGQAAPAAESSEVVSFATLVRIETNNPIVCPGMTATVEIEVRRSPDALGVPIQAVLHRRLKDLPDTPTLRAWAERHARSPTEKAFEAEARYLKIVFLLDGQVVRVQPVETGLVDERRIEIPSGISPGDRVVVGPFRILDELEDGQPVTPVPMAFD